MQGLITGFATGDPSSIQTQRTDPFAALIASLSPKVWIDAHGGSFLSLSGSDIDSATDRSGNGLHPAQTGSARPTYDATAFGGRGGILFNAASSQTLATPSFAMGARSSGSLVWRITADNQAAFEFGALNTHTLIFCQAGNETVRRASGGVGGGDMTKAVIAPVTMRVTWRVSQTSARAIFDGVATTLGASAAPPSLTSVLTMGAIAGGSIFLLSGHIGELVFADAEWSDADMDAVDAAMAARWGL